MDKARQLANQQILESQVRLRHIDELMARAQQARTKQPPASDLDALLAQIQQDRDQLAQHLDGLPQQPADALPTAVAHGKGLNGALEAVGLQLEQALAAIFH